MFEEALNSIENDDIKKFAEEVIKAIPNYFYNIPASSSMKYHPAYACEIPLGLYKHTLAVVKIINHLFEIKFITDIWDSRERDLLRVAAIMHDSFKSGTQTDYEHNKHTKHEHPLLAAETIRQCKNFKILPINEVEIIAKSIESHMGSWNVSPYSDTVLPEPKNKYQKLLHVADYLASRKDIEIKFDSE